MSGGYFDHQFHLSSIADALDTIIERADADMPPDVLEKCKHTANLLREAFVHVQRIDWLLSGDDGDAEFRRRILEDLAELSPYPIQEALPCR
ncbi:MAG: hypothetical protein LBI59_04965 [Candidatus Accumulibacter sp.]|jgi:hypothetical protein|nr:hypothetical protein [Accumulibacter sp.]